MDKLEFLKLVLEKRKPGNIHPMAFCSNLEIKKYNIKSEDFIMIINEEPYVALALGSKSWKIKFKLSNEELENIKKRELYKLNLIKSYGKIPIKYLSGNWTSSWEIFRKFKRNI